MEENTPELQMEYKDYKAKMTWNKEIRKYEFEIQDTWLPMKYEAENTSTAERMFKVVLDAYLEECQKTGQEPRESNIDIFNQQRLGKKIDCETLLLDGKPGRIRTNQLLAHILSIPDKAEEIESILRKTDDIHGLLKTPINKLSSIEPLTTKEVTKLLAIKELFKRMSDRRKLQQLITTQDMVKHIRPAFYDTKIEKFGFIALTEHQFPLGYRITSIGSKTNVTIGISDVLRQAVEMGAEKMVIFHNHLGEDSTPSRDDIYLTNTVCKAAATIAIKVIDHIILGGTTYTSCLEYGAMPWQIMEKVNQGTQEQKVEPETNTEQTEPSTTDPKPEPTQPKKNTTKTKTKNRTKE